MLEEIYKTFDKAILCMGIVAAVTADFVSKLFFGQDTVFSYDSVTIPLRWYWLLIIMGAVCGLFGVISNILMIGFRDIVAKITKIPNTIKMAAGFAISGAVGLLMPQILCGGHRMERAAHKRAPRNRRDGDFADCEIYFRHFQLWHRRTRRHALSPLRFGSISRRDIRHGGDKYFRA